MSDSAHSLRIVFMGTPEFAVASINAIVEAGYHVRAVVTAPDKPAGRGRQPMASAVKNFALEKKIEVLQPEKLRDESFLKQLKTLDADLFVVVAFRMLPESVWSMPRLGSINLHGSLLPQYRGAAPIHRAVMNGESITGVTTFFLKHEIDTGDIILQRSMPIGPDESTGEVHDRMMQLGASVLVETLDMIESDKVNSIAQNSVVHEEIYHAPKIFKDDCLINWDQPLYVVHNFIRGLSPVPGAYSRLGEKTLKIYMGRCEYIEHSVPGEVRSNGRDTLEVGCSDGYYSLTDIQLEGKKRMGVEEFLRGFQNIPPRVG